MRLIDFLDRAADLNPRRIACVDGDLRLDYAQVRELTRRISAGLAAAGLRAGARLAILSENDARAFIVMLAAQRAGGIYVPLNMRNSVEANADLLRTTGAEFLVFHEACSESAAALRKAVADVRLTIGLGRDAGDTDYESLAACRDEVPDIDENPHRIMTILPTGGTTGRSKGAMWSNRTWETLIATFWAHVPCEVPPVHLCAAPMTHAAGVLATMLLPRAPTNVVLRKPDPTAILEAIAREKVTHLYMPPTILYRLLAHPELKKHDLSSLRCLLISAAPVAPEKLREAIGVFGPAVCQAYGQAEAPFFLTYISQAEIDADERRLSSCGRPTMFTRLEIMDENGRVCEPGTTGEIVMRGNLRMEGYFENPTATADVAAHGWHHTGDIGFKDQDGYVFIVDRKKDMIISGGFNIFSIEVEKVLLAHPAVQDCAVIGVPDETWGEAVKAIVELKQGHDASEEALSAFARERLGGLRAPKSVEIWSSLPRSAVGKILKRTIRDEFWKGRARAV